MGLAGPCAPRDPRQGLPLAFLHTDPFKFSNPAAFPAAGTLETNIAHSPDSPAPAKGKDAGTEGEPVLSILHV